MPQVNFRTSSEAAAIEILNERPVIALAGGARSRREGPLRAPSTVAPLGSPEPNE